MIDVLIKGGTLVDGTGAPQRIADVAINDGRVVEVGDISDSASTTIDATDLVVAPGFVDLHTHYDAQLMWDPAATPSPLHGVTTVIGGNCGFTLAPAGAEHAEYLMRMMARVEGMPLTALQAGPPWEWTSFADYLSKLDGKIGVNAGFLAGHSAIRRAAMGESAIGSAAGPDDLTRMKALMRDALGAGALGFSTSHAPTHNDMEGNPVPSRHATADELVALAGVVREFPGTTIELIVPGCLNGFSNEEIELLAEISVVGNRPVNWNVLVPTAMGRDHTKHQLEASTRVAQRGGALVALTLPHAMKMRLSLLTGFVFDGLPGWRDVIALPVPERMKAFADPEVRRRLNEGAQSEEAGLLRGLARWHVLEIAETFAPENQGLAGRRVGDVAKERGGDAFDVLLDIVIADELRTGLLPPIGGDDPADWAERKAAWLDDRTIVGGSDAGAHLDMMCGAVYSTTLLAEGVRHHELLTMEEAIRQLTDVPARLYGLTGRGRLVPGSHADVVVFDPATVAPGRVHTRYDLPGGAWRLYAEATGIEHVLVNGVEMARGGEITGATPGTVLRSGRDTETVTAEEVAKAFA